MARVAIVILNWNGNEQLARFLPGVIATSQGAEVIVADNGSDDPPAELLRSLDGVRLLSLDRNYGYAGGYNRALERIDADYCVLLNSDVETLPGWLDPLVEALDAHPEAAVVAPKLRAWADPARFEYAGAAGGYIDFLGYPFCRGRIFNRIEEDCGQYDDAREVFWASGAALCLRTSVFRALGGFDEDFFAHMEEIDLCWRMQLAGYTVRVEPRSCVLHVGGATLQAGSPMKVRLNHRNNLMMLCKCSSPWQRAAVILFRPPLDMLAACSYLAQGRGDLALAVGRAWREFLAAHRSLCRKRRALRAARRKKPVGIYCGSILLRYLFGRRVFGKLL